MYALCSVYLSFIGGIDKATMETYRITLRLLYFGLLVEIQRRVDRSINLYVKNETIRRMTA